MVKFKKVQMTDEELGEAKLHLAHCKMQKDESDIILLEMEETLDKGLGKKLLEDDIEKLTEDIDSKTVYDNWGKTVDATEADIERMKITLNKFKKQKELDIPSRQIRNKINQLRDAKIRPDAPELQIKKLEKQIREKAYEVVEKEESPTMTN